MGELTANGCKDIQAPQTKLTVLQDKPFTNTEQRRRQNFENSIQLRPQNLKLKLRPRESYSFTIDFHQEPDYPIDLYYLMDMSYSMKEDRDKLSKLGDLLADRMRNITRNFRLGFGTFVDKNVSPFADVHPDGTVNNCGVDCVPPYSFINNMPLSTNTALFSKKVQAASLARNLDAPEGGFDALVQVLECHKQIGWRGYARKMIVFSTDAGYHIALDGRVAGIVTPNDGKCHLDANHKYTESLNQDYPSVGLIHEKIRQNKANVIFAVTEDMVPLYNGLREALPNLAVSVGKLKNDSSNIVDLVHDEYEFFTYRNMIVEELGLIINSRITQKIIMTDTAPPSVHISYRSACKSAVIKDTNICDKVEVGNKVSFEVTIQVDSCEQGKHFEFGIGPSSLTEMVNVSLEVLCDCGCNTDKVQNSPSCSGKGDYSCGVCSCYGEYRGRSCQCSNADASTAQMKLQCKRGRDPRAPECENRGDCECGECRCYARKNPAEKISGRYCECDNFNCPVMDGKMCNGHGKCECQRCLCDAGWTGQACECSSSEDSCLASNGKICNGMGYCRCGKCTCRSYGEGLRYSGDTCEDCPTCPQKCQLQQQCVQCKQFDTGEFSTDDQCKTCDLAIKPVDRWSSDLMNNTHVVCSAVDQSDGCTFYWVSQEVGKKVSISVLERKECPQIRAWHIVIPLMLGIIIIGLFFAVVAKVALWYYEKKDYENWLKEQEKPKNWNNQNPVYQPPTSEFKNPIFKNKTN